MENECIYMLWIDCIFFHVTANKMEKMIRKNEKKPENQNPILTVVQNILFFSEYFSVDLQLVTKMAMEATVATNRHALFDVKKKYLVHNRVH